LVFRAIQEDGEAKGVSEGDTYLLPSFPLLPLRTHTLGVLAKSAVDRLKAASTTKNKNMLTSSIDLIFLIMIGGSERD